MASVERLLEIMARLRGPGGCPWDREQTPRTLRPYVLEEAHEVAEAIDADDPRALRGELGDLLLQVVFLSQIAEEEGWFAFSDVADAISDKLVRRHPHVFGDASAESVDEVWKRWEEIKRAEREAEGEDAEAPSPSLLDGVPKASPALLRARIVANKASRAGFDWPDADAVAGKVREEIDEVLAARPEGDERLDEEIGDLLFAVTSLARHVGVDPEGALHRATTKFSERFRAVEAEVEREGQRFDDLDAVRLDALWERVKRG